MYDVYSLFVDFDAKEVFLGYSGYYNPKNKALPLKTYINKWPFSKTEIKTYAQSRWTWADRRGLLYALDVATRT